MPLSSTPSPMLAAARITKSELLIINAGDAAGLIEYSVMTQYVALLRGIMPTNPNMRNEKLRSLFEELGFARVRTVIASGNVLFETGSKNVTALEARIEKALPAKLGFKSTTIIRSREQLQKLVDKNPFKGIIDGPQFRLNVTFLKNHPDTRLSYPFVAENKTFKLLGLHDCAICSVMDVTSTAKTPDLMSWLEKQFGKEITTRTWKTVHRILEKL